MKKRLFTALLLLAVTLALAVAAGAAEAVKEGPAGDNLTYTLYDDGKLVFEGEGEMWDFTSRWEDQVYADRPIPWLNEDGENTLISSIVFCDGMTSIGDYAFQEAWNLKGSLMIPASIRRIGDGSFGWCGLDGNLTFEDGSVLEYIGNEAFCEVQITGGLTIPDSVTYIGYGSFTGMWWPTGNTFTYEDEEGNEVTEDEYMVLKGKLDGELVLGASVQYIGADAFHGQPFSGDLMIPDSVTEIGGDAFSGQAWDGETYDEEGNAAWWLCAGSFEGGKLTIGSGLEVIRGGAFRQTGFTEDLVIPDHVKEIEGYSFYGAGFKGDLHIGSSVETIGEEAFNGIAFKNLYIEAKHIGNHAFVGSLFTGDLNILDTVETIGDGAFENIEWIEIKNDRDDVVGYHATREKVGRLSLGKNLQSIGERAFWFVPFGGDLVIPDSVTDIGEGAFAGTEFTGSLTVGSGIKEIPEHMFEGNMFTGALTLKEGLERICDNAFSSVPFTGELVIPDSVKEIGRESFSAVWVPDGEYIGDDEWGNPMYEHGWHRNRTGTFTGLKLGNGLEKIGESAFEGQPFEGKVTIPGNVKEIGERAFQWSGADGCGLVIEDGVEIISHDAFNTSGYSGDLVIPDSVKEIGNGAFSAGWTFVGSETNEDGSTWDHYERNKGGLISLTLGNGLQVIGECAFENQSFTGDLAIPDSVTVIKPRAFDHAGFTGDLYIGANVTEFGSDVFSGNCFKGDIMVAMKDIPENAFAGILFEGNLIIMDSVETIGYGAFENHDWVPVYEEGHEGEDDHIEGYTPSREKVGRLLLGKNLKSIESAAFHGIHFTGSLEIPDSVTYLGDRFQNEEGFKPAPFEDSGFDGDLIIGSGLKTLYTENQFGGCGFTGSLTIKAVEEIPEWYFSGMQFTGDLTLGEGVRTVKFAAFHNMPFTGTLTISDGVETLENSAFWNDHFTGSLVIPASVKKIGGYVLEYSQFDAIVFEGDVTDWCEGWWDRHYDDEGNLESEEYVPETGNCFSGNENLTAVYFRGNIPEGVKDQFIFGDPKQMEERGLTIYYLAGTDWEAEASDEDPEHWNISGDGYRIKKTDKLPTDITRGDVNGDGKLDSNDAIYLLRHTMNSDRYPINQSGDMNGNGKVDSNDAIYLLRHTMNSDRYPLK